MKHFSVFAGYQQFYVADAGLEPSAPEHCSDEHCQQRHNTMQHIAALCPVGNVSARILSCGPSEERPTVEHSAEFEIETQIEVPSGRIGIYGWPWDIKDEFAAEPGTYSVIFTGHALGRVDDEEDYYIVQVRKSA